MAFASPFSSVRTDSDWFAWISWIFFWEYELLVWLLKKRSAMEIDVLVRFTKVILIAGVSLLKKQIFSLFECVKCP